MKRVALVILLTGACEKAEAFEVRRERHAARYAEFLGGKLARCFHPDDAWLTSRSSCKVFVGNKIVTIVCDNRTCVEGKTDDAGEEPRS